MNITVMLSEDDVEFLDRFATAHHLESRSAVVGRAIQLLREPELVPLYAEAWDEWASNGEAEVWEVVTGDGVA